MYYDKQAIKLKIDISVAITVDITVQISQVQGCYYLIID